DGPQGRQAQDGEEDRSQGEGRPQGQDRPQGDEGPQAGQAPHGPQVEEGCDSRRDVMLLARGMRKHPPSPLAPQVQRQGSDAFSGHKKPTLPHRTPPSDCSSSQTLTSSAFSAPLPP